MPEKNKPAHKIRNGALTVTIWKNDGQEGPFYTTAASRSYKDGDQWKETNSFHQQDLLTLAKMLDQAETWIAQEKAKARTAQHGAEEPPTGYADQETERKRAGGRQP